MDIRAVMQVRYEPVVDRRTGVEPLGLGECRALLDANAGGIGRLAFIRDQRPKVLPVNYVTADDRVVFCTGEGLKLDAAVRQAPAEFEIDDVDLASGTGWSVVVSGSLRLVRDPTLTMLFSSYGLQPFAAGEKRNWVQLDPEQITGRRIPAPALGWVR